jgi:hypothetical protein
MQDHKAEGGNEGKVEATGTRARSRRLKQYARGTDARSRSLTLAQELKALQERPEFAEFADKLEAAMRDIRAEGRRTADSDKRAVLASLTEADRMGVAVSVDDVCDDTGFSKSDVRAILDEMTMRDLVAMYEREGKRGPRVMLFRLRRTGIGERFESVPFRSRMPAEATDGAQIAA